MSTKSLFEEYAKTSRLGNQLYSILFQDENYYVWMTPSQFLNEMQMSTEDRMERLKSSRGKQFKLKKLQFSPEIIIFQNYQPEITQNIAFSIMNTTQKMMTFKVYFEKTQSFQLQPERSTIQLAPGMKTVINILFTALNYKDYLHKIEFETARETMILPIICIGPRPMLCIPDRVTLPTTPVKKECTTTFVISNIGVISTILSLKSTTYFQINPTKIFLPPGECTEINVTFKSNYPGNIEEDLLISLESGEQLISKLHGRSLVLEVFLPKAILDFPKSYIETPHTEQFEIVNKSKHTLKFAWMNDKTLTNKNSSLPIASKTLNEEENLDKSKHDFVKKVPENLFMYSDKHFDITPICGEIPPFTEQLIEVIFMSRSVGKYCSMAYCDVSGNIERLPLTITATCLGPNIVLDPTHVIADLMFGKETNISVSLSNQGEIDGDVVFKKLGSSFGTGITCEPSEFSVKVDETVKVFLRIVAHNPGPYIDDVCFEVKISGECLKLTLQGVVSSPRIRTEPTSFAFGDVPIGFKVTEKLNVKNLSEVAFDLHYKIPTDGTDLTCIDVEDPKQVRSNVAIPTNPKEFSLIPEFCTIYPTEIKDITIQLIPGIQRQHETVLELNFHESESHPTTIPISYNAVSANVISMTPDISLKNCFYKNQVISTVTLQNLSNTKGYFHSICEEDENSDIECNIVPSEGIFEANQQFFLDLFLKCNVIKNASKTIRVQILGSPSPLTVCELTMEGTGPKIAHNPKSLHWGELNLLHRSGKTIRLTNQSPIDASFSCHFKTNSSLWDINIKHGILRAEESLDLIVHVFLKDADNYSEKLTIDIKHCRSIVIPLSVKGVNSCIVMEPAPESQLDFGTQLTFRKNKSTITLKNYGSKMHQIKWSNSNELLRKKERVASQYFFFSPQEFKLGSMESRTIEIQFYLEIEATIKEHWYLFGVIEHGRKEMLKEIDITASFVNPTLEKSKEDLLFEINRGYGEQQFFVLDYVFLKNKSPLDLKLRLQTNSPFQLVCEKSKQTPLDTQEQVEILTKVVGKSVPKNLKKISNIGVESSTDLTKILTKFTEIFSLVNQTSLIIPKGESICVNVLFNENILLNKRRHLIKDTLAIYMEDNPNQDTVSLVGEINIPEVELSPGHLVLECQPSQTTTVNFNIKNITPLTVKYRLLYHQLKEKMATLHKTTAPKKMKKACLMKANLNHFMTDVVEKSLSKHLFLSDHESYDDVGNILHSIVNMLPNTECEEIENSYRNVAIVDEKKKFVDNLVKETFVQNLIFSNFLTNCTDFNVDRVLSDDFKFIYDKHNDINKLLKGHILFNRSEGELPPFGSQEITALFKPSTALDLNMKILCLVECGLSKYLNVRAISGEVQFTLDKNIIDFGICLYYETYTQTVIIRNSGCLSFEFTISHPDEAEVYPENNWQSKIMEVSPNFGKLSAGQSITLFVKICPGIFGKFKKFIKFDLANYKPIVIPITGLGTFPQVDIDADYSYKNEVSPLLQYNSISNLTEEWLNIDKVGDNNKSSNRNLPKQLVLNCQTSQQSGNSFVEGVFNKPYIIGIDKHDLKNGNNELFHTHHQDDWVVVTNDVEDKSVFPSLSDIKFTLERALISKQLNSSTNTNVVNDSLFTFKRFLDFGIITYDHLVKKKIELTSYSFYNVSLILLHERELPYWIRVVLPKLFNKDCNMKKIVISVNFDSNVYTIDNYEQFSCVVYIQVIHGAIIPIEVRATLAVPMLYTNTKILDFGSVPCGNFKVCSFPIFNSGKIPCTWSAAFLNAQLQKGVPFQIHNKTGVLNHNEQAFIRLSFKPKNKETTNYILSLTMEHNLNNIVVNVCGNGLPSSFDIVGSKVDFVTALPYSDPQESFFGICNPNKYPIQLQFHESKRNRDSKTLNHFISSYEEDGQVQEILDDQITCYKKYTDELWSRCEYVQKSSFKTFIIWHQMEMTDNFNLIKKMRNEINLPLWSIDKLLLKSIALQETESSTSIRQAISKTYLDVTCRSSEKHFDNEEDRLENEVNKIYSHFCETNTDVTAHKIGNRKGKQLKIHTLADNVSSTSSSSQPENEKIFSFSDDLILDVLKYTFSKFSDGCIISGLNCMFIESQCQTLRFILQSLPNKSSLVHFVLIHEKFIESSHSLNLVKARNQITHKNARRLLKIAENWDNKNNCVRVSFKPKPKDKKSTLTTKKCTKMNNLSNDSKQSVICHEDIGIKSWILTSNNLGTVGFLIDIIKGEIDELNNAILKSLNPRFSEYKLKVESNNFKLHDKPFSIQPMNEFKSKTKTEEDNKDSTQVSILDIHPHHDNENIYKDVLDVISIPAESLWNLKIAFEPRCTGKFLKTFYIASPGSYEVKDVHITGMCDLPRICDDPYFMFSKLVEFPNSSPTCPAFDVSQNVFDFGSLFCSTLKERLPIKEEVSFKNISVMNVVIVFSFLQPKSYLTVVPDRLIIKPKMSDKVTITLKPKVAGVFKNTLLCSIKDNPSPFKIHLKWLGVTPAMKLSQDTLEFGKILLYRQEIKSLFLTNCCILPLQWSIRNLETFKNNLFVSKQTGCLNGMSSEEIKFYYGGNNPIALQKVPLHVDVYEKLMNKDVKPNVLFTKVIKVSLECYDVRFDCKFHPENETHVNFGKIIVGSLKTRKVYFTNKGVYGLIFKIVKSDSSAVKTFVNDVYAKPATGLLKPNCLPLCIEITWRATFEMNVIENPILNCHLVDVSEQQKTIAIFPLKISVECIFNK